LEDNFLERPTLLGLIGGAAVFIIILIFIILNHANFDQQLIDKVAEGVPAEKLIPEIDAETDNLKSIARARLETVVNDQKYWGNGELATTKEYVAYTTGYEFELRIISDYDTARKKFARREITKREFLNLIKGPKEFYSTYENLRVLRSNKYL
jgi:hypothetical protein